MNNHCLTSKTKIDVYTKKKFVKNQKKKQSNANGR